MSSILSRRLRKGPLASPLVALVLALAAPAPLVAQPPAATDPQTIPPPLPALTPETTGATTGATTPAPSPTPNYVPGGLIQPLPATQPASLPSALTPGITEGSEWDRAHQALLATPPAPAVAAMAGAVTAWRSLASTDALSFADYAAFLLAFPSFPDEPKLRLSAEKALAAGRPGVGTTPARIAAYFDHFPPLTNPARAQYALALAALARPEASATAKAAWRGGGMSDVDELALLTRWGRSFSASDTDARLDALLWDGALDSALRILPHASAPAQAIALARLALLQGRDPQSPTPVASPAAPLFTPSSDSATPESDAPQTDANPAPSPQPFAQPAPLPPVWSEPAPPPPGALADPGYLADRARFLMRHGRASQAASLLASHPPLSHPAADPRRWVGLSLAVAREAGPDAAIAIAEQATQGFAPGTDISDLSFAIRDTTTSLMWLGGTQALWWRGDPQRAAALFRAYAAAARTPQSRAKGQFWAARALARTNPADPAAQKAYEAAANYPDQFYGLLALEALHRPLPSLADTSHPRPTAAQREAFEARPLTQAVRLVARDAEWQTTIRFFRAIAESATSEADFTLLADLARELGRRDLAVITGTAAETAGYPNFRDAAFPLIPTPLGADWTAVHAVARQESQFAQNAISSAGARGLMQLMPGTAADQARHLGLPYSASALTADPALNIATGNAYFTHLLSVYNGSWPLAAAAYNAGPGNVARWLRDVGDPRAGAIDWADWIEHIPLTETRGYVSHILENAVVYEARNPTHAHYTGGDAIGYFLRGR